MANTINALYNILYPLFSVNVDNAVALSYTYEFCYWVSALLTIALYVAPIVFTWRMIKAVANNW